MHGRYDCGHRGDPQRHLPKHEEPAQMTFAQDQDQDRGDLRDHLHFA